MTPAEVAAMLFVDPKTVTRWARAGKLDAIRTPGGHRRYRRSDVLDIMSGTYRSQTLPGPRSPEALVTASGEHDPAAAAVVPGEPGPAGPGVTGPTGRFRLPQTTPFHPQRLCGCAPTPPRLRWRGPPPGLPR